jgi:hypothetical protein
MGFNMALSAKLQLMEEVDVSVRQLLPAYFIKDSWLVHLADLTQQLGRTG